MLRKVQSVLQKTEVSHANKEQIKEKAKESIRDRLAKGKSGPILKRQSC